MDREALSRTYGSLDRTFWAWKFTDYPCPRFQEGLYALTWFYLQPLPINAFYGNEQVLEWIKAGFRCWREQQHKDGSFDEAYPYERSLAATSFTSFYLGEALLLLGDALPEKERAANICTLRRAGDWLCQNDEHHGILSNHLAVAAAALVIITRLVGEVQYGRRADHFLERIYTHQSQEGWHEEYGGVDLGYQTHGIFYLARIWSLTHDETLLESLKRSVIFLSYLIHPNGTLGGEYGSRNTSFYFPAGFEILAPVCEEAAAIALFMRSSVYEQKAAGLAMMDAYNFCPLLNNYLFAHAAVQKLSSPVKLPFMTTGQWSFPDAGLFIHSTGRYHAIFATSKGGVIKIYDKKTNRLAYSDCGYWLELKDGTCASSQSFSRANRTEITSSSISVITRFATVNQKNMTPWLFMAFRLFTITIGQHKALARWIKSFLVKALVSRRKTIGLSLDRKVHFNPLEVTIEDHVTDMSSEPEDARLHLDAKFSTIHMGSSRYFQWDDLDFLPINSNTPLSRTFTWRPE
jgi:hypothetical protein